MLYSNRASPFRYIAGLILTSIKISNAVQIILWHYGIWKGKSFHAFWIRQDIKCHLAIIRIECKLGLSKEKKPIGFQDGQPLTNWKVSLRFFNWLQTRGIVEFTQDSPNIVYWSHEFIMPYTKKSNNFFMYVFVPDDILSQTRYFYLTWHRTIWQEERNLCI